jgi:LmbE family N-acetylglucosaminyl deacetylase
LEDIVKFRYRDIRKQGGKMKMSRRILVVAAHPDDEWFGLGGTLLKYKKQFHYEVNILIVTDGERGDNRGPERVRESESLCKMVFGTHLKSFGIPANEVPDNIVGAVSMLDVVIHQLQPEIVFTHYISDTHQDHRAVFNIVQSSSRKAPDSSVWLFESPSSVDFTPNMIVNVEEYFMDKIMIYRKYFGKEIKGRPKFSVDHIERINSYWGSKIMKSYAESFRIYKGVVL